MKTDNRELQRIDPRGPRFGAGITSVLALASLLLSTSEQFIFGYIIMATMFALFFWSVFLPRPQHPYNLMFQKFVRVRLAPAKELEDPRPPQFAQKVGLSFAVVGMLSPLVGDGSVLLAIASSFIFLAAFLNAVFGLCLGCQMYLLLRRLGVGGSGRL